MVFLSEAEMNVYRSYVTMIGEPGSKDESKLQAAQEINENLELISNSPQYQLFLEHILRTFIKVMMEGQPQFISEHGVHQLRKLMLEIIYRLPNNEYLRPHVDSLVTLCIKIIEIDNEDVVLVCMRIIIELTKNFRPTYNGMITTFLQFAKKVYNELPDRVNDIFKIRAQIQVKELYELDLESLLNETYTITTIECNKGFNAEGKPVLEQFTIIPRGSLSLKALQELPIIIVLLYQLYKENIKRELVEYIPSVIRSLTLKPLPEIMADKNFNKEVFVDFMSAQIRTLSFLAYIIRIYQEVVMKNHKMMVEGMLNMLRLCPKEVTGLRRDLFIASRHILSTELRIMFAPHVDELFDEDVLLNRGWTTRETLRPLAYSTLADFVHHIRQHLSMPTIVKAVELYSLNVHDESLPTGIETMSCKLLLNLVECIQQHSKADPNSSNEQTGYLLLSKIMKICVLKFKTIVKLHIPFLQNRIKQMQQQQQQQQQLLQMQQLQSQQQANQQDQNAQQNPQQTPAAGNMETALDKVEEIKYLQFCSDIGGADKKEPGKMEKKFGFPLTQPPNYTVTDCKCLVRTLTCAIKSATFACIGLKTGVDEDPRKTIVFAPREVNLFIRLMKWALQAFDIYTITVPGVVQGIRLSNQARARSKEEVEVLEHFTGIFTSLHPQTFKEIFSCSIKILVDRIAVNPSLIVISDTFLTNKETSAIYATIMVEFLLNRMSEMGEENQDRSNLYLKLFKTVFDSVSTFSAENEHMLQPYLHQIVNKSMETAMTAKEPYNYFVLLRALFRSIGGGSHDLLYQEFLPLLPTLLQGLNCLQSGLHKQHMKDLFVELCLTVPVRLSSLLPYLPMLMDPLVSAFNGSPTLISQGLRTLELCVDNLQPDFLYDHIQPVRADLMQALWRSLHNTTDQVAHVAFRVLGKLGGGNRKMMNEPQRLDYQCNRTNNPSVVVHFVDYVLPINMCLQKIVETAVSALKLTTTDVFYRRQCWEVLKGFIIASISPEENSMYRLLSHPSFTEGPVPRIQGVLYKFNDQIVRNTHISALTGVFVAAAIKDLGKVVVPVMVAIVRHYTMVAISQQAGPFPMHKRQNLLEGHMDSLILAEAIATVMGYEEKELCKPGRLALAVMLSTATTVLGSKKRACELPLMEYLVEKVCALCYERPWYAKLGGCEAIRFLYTKMAINWVYKHLYTFVKAQLFVMMDLSGEVSNGTIDRAKGNLEEMVRRCAVLVDPNSDAELAAVQKKALFEVTYELTRQVTSPNDYLREEAMRLLRVFAEVQNKSITEVMECHKNVLVDIIPPKKHLLRHQAANAQIGLMEGNTFCTTLVPRLFTLDLNIPEHKMFFHEVCNVCDVTDAGLSKLPCYKSIPSLVPLRKAAMKALSACHYVPNVSEKIFNSLYQALERSDPELQEAAFQCMKNFVSGSLIDLSMVHEVMRPLLSTFCDYRNINVSGARRLCYLVQLFPTSFKEKLCEQLLSHMQHFFETLVQQQRSGVKVDTKDTEQIIAIIIDIFYHVPAARPRFIEILCLLIFQSEKNLRIGRSSPYHEPLIRFLLKYPLETIVLFLQEKYIKEYEWGNYLHFMLKHENSKPFRDVFDKPEIIEMLANLIDIFSKTDSSLSTDEKASIRYHAIKTVSLIIKYNDQWLAAQKKITSILTQIWTDSDSYQEIFVNITAIPHTHWNEPKLIVTILLHYFTHHPLKIDLLFYLMTAFSHRFTSDFQFLKSFLVQTVAQGYTVEWKRSAFLRFCELFHMPNVAEELKAKILQFIIIPCFTVSFERNEGERLITGSNKPFQGTADNLVTIFLVKLVEEVKHTGCSDSIRILLQQLACVIVEYASHYLNTSKTEGNRLRILMEFVWPCLSGKKCTDSITEYHGHLLLCHIISKMAIHKKIILQVFRSLLKANALEVRPIVRLALDILTPILPNRMEDGYRMLTHWTKKILLEEGHSMPQLVHMLQLIVRHYKVYYPVRHRLIHNLIHSIQRLTVNTSPSLDYRKLAVDLCEVMIKWELQRIRNESDTTETSDSSAEGLKRSGEILSMQARGRFAGGIASPVASTSFTEESDSNKPIDRMHADAIMNYLTRIACQVNELTTTSGTIGDQLARRCLSIIKTALKSDIWPDNNIDIRLQWVDKLLCSVSGTNPNYGNICTALELVTFVFSVMKKEDVLALCKLLQNGINLCISSTNPKIIRYVHALISRLMSIFPIDPTTSPVASKYEELDKIYSCVAKVILDGLATYEKNTNATATSLYGAIMLIKAGCSNNQAYVDRFSSSFVRVIQRLAREHHSSSNVETIGVTELLTYCLDMLKNRVGVMKIDTRKTFIAVIITGLIERTNDAKLMKALCKLMEEWMVNGKNPGYCGPNVQEKSVLLVKMMQCIEKRFPDLNCQFLEIIYNIYKEEISKPTELMLKLEVAFLSGLRCTNPTIRGKFFELFDSSIQRKLIFRLLYMVSSQNWEGMSQHYWLKQCIELILVTSVPDERIQLAEGSGILPSITSVIDKADPDEKALLAGYFAVKEEQSETASICSMDASVEDMDIELADSASQSSIELLNNAGGESLAQLVSRQIKFLDSVKDFKTFDFLKAASQLCHMDTSLTEQIWLNIFPQLWKILHERERTELTGEITPFVASGSHVVQKDAHPSAICTFYESLAHCNPPVNIKPRVMTYLGKSHNLWHRVTLTLEKMTIDSNFFRDKQFSSNDCYDFEPETVPQQDIIDSLADMYSALCEEDMWCGLWQKHAKHPETIIALTYEQQGFFEQALGAYELVLGKARQTYSNMPSPISLISEQRLWEKQWIKCTKELNQWDHLLDYTQTKNLSNPVLILESAWRVPDWNLMKEALSQVDLAYPGILTWKEDLYKGFLAICHPEDKLLHLVERYVEQASVQCIKEWRKLPHIVSHVHIHLLQAAQQIIELQEAYQIHQSLLHGRSSTSSLHDIKAIVKTWRNRLPVISDDLSHWSDIFTWRQHHYQFVTSHYDNNQDQATRQHSILGVHASAQAIIHFGKIARKQNLTAVCLDSLTRLYTIPSVPIVDCFQKIRQQVKCYLQMAAQSGKSEIQEGLDAIEYTNMRYLTREMTAEFYALKGMLLAQLGRSEEANRAFSVAVQMHDTLVKGWALWGDFMEQQFTKTSPPNISTGISAVTCFLHACRNQNESRSRKYLAKVLWLLTYDDEKFSLTEAVDRYSVGVPPSLWLPWIPQLLTCLGRNEGRYIVNLISQVGRMFPQAVYFPIRTMYFTQKIEQRERYKSAERAAGKQNESVSATGVENSQAGISDSLGPIKATPAMLRCSKIMQLQREIHPTILLSLEGIVDQMVWFRENWCEEVLRQLRLGLAKCYTLAFENRGAVNDANISKSTHNFLKKLVSTFGIGLEMYTSSVSTVFGNAGSESLARRTQVTMSDPAFQTMKQKFADDFDFSVPGAMKLHNFISKLKKWIRLLENKIQALPKSFLIEEKCRFLSNFSLQTAEIELPGEFLLPKVSTKHSHYYVRIARFMPRVEIVEKHNTATRRLYIRGHNGKIYAYLIMQESGMGDARREEIVLQLMRMLNHYLTKQKETSRRFLNYTVSRVVAVSPQLRLVEDNPASLSLLDICKQMCSKKNAQYDEPLTKYYDRLAFIQARGGKTSHQVLRDILMDVQISHIAPNLLKTWAFEIYKTPTDYWTFRKMITLQLSLSCFAEYVFHLTRLNPDMMFIHQDSGLINVSYFKFDVDDSKSELNGNRAVPFRLTPNLIELITEIGICGPLIASMIATARCFSYPNFKLQTILRALLRDEMITSYKRKLEEEKEVDDLNNPPADVPGEIIVTMVTNSVNSIMQRLSSLTNFDGVESKVATLVNAAKNVDNLCRMDPAWHPWL